MTAYNDNPNAIGDFVMIKANGDGRRSRAARIMAEVRRYQEEHKVTLALLGKTYSETHGFLSQSGFNYRIERTSK